VEALQLPHPRSITSPWITVTVGVATIHPHQLENPEALFIAADRAMYVAKEQGRNQVRSSRASPASLATMATSALARH
jgi:diguanylate cyclase (GGDEF)-like protein